MSELNSENKILVVFDTAAIRNSVNDSDAWNQFKEAQEHVSLVPAITYCVFVEYASYLFDIEKGSLDKANKNLNSLVSVLEKYGLDKANTAKQLKEELRTVEVTYEDMLERTRIHLRSIFGMDALILDIPPHLSHKQLLWRSVKQQKPFSAVSESKGETKGKDKGYKDVLNWLSFVGKVREFKSAVFVTPDSDYLNKEQDSFSDELLLDLSDNDREKVTWVRSINDLVEYVNSQKLQEDSELFEIIDEGVLTHFLVSANYEWKEDVTEFVYNKFSSSSHSPDYVEVTNFSDPIVIKMLSAFKLDEEESKFNAIFLVRVDAQVSYNKGYLGRGLIPLLESEYSNVLCKASVVFNFEISAIDRLEVIDVYEDVSIDGIVVLRAQKEGKQTKWIVEFTPNIGEVTTCFYSYGSEDFKMVSKIACELTSIKFVKKSDFEEEKRIDMIAAPMVVLVKYFDAS